MTELPLTPADSHRLKSAQGWVGLLNFSEANAELERITPDGQSHPDVLATRVDVCVKTQNWVG
jgi:hypothetical protein